MLGLVVIKGSARSGIQLFDAFHGLVHFGNLRINLLGYLFNAISLQLLQVLIDNIPGNAALFVATLQLEQQAFPRSSGSQPRWGE